MHLGAKFVSSCIEMAIAHVRLFLSTRDLGDK